MGQLLTLVMNFLIVAGVMFGLVNLIQRVRQNGGSQARRRVAAPGGVAATEIRDLLAEASVVFSRLACDWLRTGFFVTA